MGVILAIIIVFLLVVETPLDKRIQKWIEKNQDGDPGHGGYG